MSEDEKAGGGAREHGLAEAAASVRALSESMGAPAEGKASASASDKSAGAEPAPGKASAAGGSGPAEGKASASASDKSAGAEPAPGKASAAGGSGPAESKASASSPPAKVSAPASPPRPASPSRQPDDELDDEAVSRELHGGSWRRYAVLGLLVGLALGIGAAVLLGQRNAERYFLRCGAEHIVAQQGRGFPPWGERTLAGKQWKPIALPLAAECRDRQAQSEVELAGWYAEALMEQAGQVLAAGKLEQLETAAAALEQAALLTRAPERRAERAQLQRLWGDIEYGRALAKLAQARQALADAARGLEEAAKQQPRYATDAAARARELRRLLAELGAPGMAEAGASASPLPAPAPSAPAGAAGAPSSSAPAPSGAAPSAPSPPTSQPPGPPTSQPSGAPSSSPSGGTSSSPTGGTSSSAPPSSAPPSSSAAPDAGPAPIPTGGVLL